MKLRTIDQLGMAGMAAVTVGAVLLLAQPHSPPSSPRSTEMPVSIDGWDHSVSVEESPDAEPVEKPKKNSGREPRRPRDEEAPGRSRPAVVAPSVAPTVAPRAAPPVARPVAPPVAPPARTAPDQPVQVFADFVVSSFNVLGSSHTDGPGGRPGYETGVTRAGYAAQLLAQRQVQIVGFQELQPDQLRTLQSATGGRYAFYPGMAKGREAGVNSVAWLRSEWTAVDSRTVTMPYFAGNARELPVVRLRHDDTGLELWVANFHNPADARGPAGHWRAEATRRQVALANDLRNDTGLPVLYTGDFNDRERYFCPLVGGTELEASNGGSADGSCAPPDPMHVDWIFATPEVTWLSHLADRGPMVRRITDHPMIVARAKLTGVLTLQGQVDPETVEQTRRALEAAED